VDGFLLELWNPLSLPVTKSLNTDENGVKHIVLFVIVSAIFVENITADF
jgi:hypothetical protein